MAAQGTTRSTNPPTPKRVAKSASSQSLNHLLNFSLPPRQSHQVQNLTEEESQAWHNSWRFVNAQYRFVMNPLGDYTVHFADPDIFFQWQDILQIIIPRSSALAAAAAGGGNNSSHEEGHITCPICLSPPTAPRMTKCGHVFCFQCILHYLGTSENPKWARCPICLDSVNEKQLKSVHWFTPSHSDDDNDDGSHPRPSSSSVSADIDPIETPKPGSTLRMRLMQRPQITTLALPRSHTWPSDLLPPHQAPFHFLPDVYTYAKFMVATPSYLIENLRRDLSELASEAPHALKLRLNAQIAKATALDSDVLRTAIDHSLQMERNLMTNAVFQAKRKQERENAPTPEPSDIPAHFLSAQVHHPPSPSPTPTSRGPKSRKNLNPPPPSTSAYYYYQAASGQPIFLHPLDIKVLSAHFGAYAAFPDSIAVRVEAATEGSVDADLRRRCKHLAHIPEGADVVFVEADLEGVVGTEGLRAFEGAIKARRARRREKDRRDEKARTRAEEREREKLAAATSTSAAAWSSSGDGLSWAELERDTASPAPPSPTLAAQAPPQQQQQQQQSGAWGARSFAAAANAGSGAGRTPPRTAATARRPQLRYDDDNDGADEWAFELELDRAWNELEIQRGPNVGNGGRGGGQRRRARMVVLGGGTGRRR
ncbi:hypothetical protein EDB86DRAFT_3210754 [Lactarius hatsudake]|nr:hypothetical protein EDB86DRAFT_3210754 [Lactarius hatsudake]